MSCGITASVEATYMSELYVSVEVAFHLSLNIDNVIQTLLDFSKLVRNVAFTYYLIKKL